MRTTASRSQRRRLAPTTARIVSLARESRKALARVVDLVNARYAEFLTITDGGAPLSERRQLTEEERVERLQFALTWLQRSEELNRQLRGAIEKALEKEWRNL